MAGDWIKMRIDLQTHPKVVRILSALGADKFRVIGGLHAVWSVFDTHSVDGKLIGYTPALMDHVIGWNGFAQAMVDIEWLFIEGGNSLVLPEFSEHNGKSGKRRAEDQKRKRDERKGEECPQFVRNESDADADEKWTREEKSREDITSSLRSEVKAPRASKRKTATTLPDGFAISERVRKWAGEKGHGNLDQHLESFQAKARAKGYTYADWDSAFMEAIRADWAQLNRHRPAPSQRELSNLALGGHDVEEDA